MILLCCLQDEGNEKVDKLAIETPNNEQREINLNLKHCTYEDILRIINITIEIKWQDNGEETKLIEIKETTES